MAILRLNQTLQQTGSKRSHHYRKTAEGLFTAPVKLNGARASGWPEHEVKAIVAARTAGAEDAEIRSLVEKLHASRAAIYRSALSRIPGICTRTHDTTSYFDPLSLGVEDKPKRLNTGEPATELDDAPASPKAKKVRRAGK